MKTTHLIRRTLATLVLGSTLALPMAQLSPMGAHAAPAGAALAGVWYQTNPASGGLHALLFNQAGGRMLVQATGACSPSPCPWGTAPVFTAFNGHIVETLARFTFRFEQKTLGFRMAGDGYHLSVTMRTHFTDASGRADRSEVDVLYRQASI